MNTGDSHVGNFTSALVMLAAVATTFLTYGYYKDDQLAEQYETEGQTLEHTASALVSLRLQEEALASQASTTEEDMTEETTEEAPELE